MQWSVRRGSAAGGFVRQHRHDILLSVLVLVVVTAAIAADVGGGRPPDAIAYLYAVGLAALMLVRRRFPTLALAATAVAILAYYAAGYPSIGLAVPVGGALYSATEAGRARAAVATAVGLLVVSTASRLIEGESLAYLLGYEFASSAGLMAAAIALGDGVRSRRLWRDEQRRRAAQAEIDRHREVAHQRQQERLRIARDLHDSLAHTASVISLHSHLAEETLVDDPVAARTALANVRLATGQAIRERRSTVGMLRSPDHADGPPEGLHRLAEVIAATNASGVSVDMQVAGQPVELGHEVGSTAFRIVQESLTNVLRHAGAVTAEVLLTYTPVELRVRVTDDGHGSAESLAAGHGITGMQERARIVGGTCTAGPLAGGNFRVEASLPLTPVLEPGGPAGAQGHPSAPWGRAVHSRP